VKSLANIAAVEDPLGILGQLRHPLLVFETSLDPEDIVEELVFTHQLVLFFELGKFVFVVLVVNGADGIGLNDQITACEVAELVEERREILVTGRHM